MSPIKYAAQNMPTIVSLENGNEQAVKHKRTCLAMSVPNGPRSLLLETDVFKITLRKVMSSVSVGWVWTDGYSEKKTPGVSRIRMHPSEASNLLRPFYLLYLF